jgi:hypothetical protein
LPSIGSTFSTFQSTMNGSWIPYTIKQKKIRSTALLKEFQVNYLQIWSASCSFQIFVVISCFIDPSIKFFGFHYVEITKLVNGTNLLLTLIFSQSIEVLFKEPGFEIA